MNTIGANNAYRFPLYGATDSVQTNQNPPSKSDKTSDDAARFFAGMSAQTQKTVKLPTSDKTDKTDKTDKSNTQDADKKRAEDQQASKYKQIEQKVIAHEHAHMAAGGALAGGASYSYTRGPDGRMYIVGGEVGISMPASDNPAETIQMMDQVQRAALAPSDPSGQDLRVAAEAAMRAQQARAELQKQAQQQQNPYATKQQANEEGLQLSMLI